MDVHSPCTRGVSHNPGVPHPALAVDSARRSYCLAASLLLLIMVFVLPLVLLVLVVLQGGASR
jgi:hypothetical protein